MKSRADQRAIAQAFLLATKQLAKLDEQVLSHMRASPTEKVVEQIAPLTLDVLRPLVEKLTSILTAHANDVAAQEFLSVARVAKSDHKLQARSAVGVPFVGYIEKARPRQHYAEAKPQVDPDDIQKQVAKLVVDITNDQRKTLKKVIARRYDSDSRGNDTLVKDVMRTVGLTDREADAVMNLRDSLEERELPPKRVENEVERYADRLHQLRAQRIARTESVRVETHGRKAAWKAAKKDGLLSRDAEEEWVSDAGACDVCKKLDGKRVPIGGKFKGPDGLIPGPPAHPHCLCDLVARDE